MAEERGKMFEPVRIAPSILSADFLDLGKAVRMAEEGGAGFIHVDVMDGHFVPNITIGVPHVKQLKKFTSVPLDVHLMISNPMEQLPWFIDAGADIITVHAETLEGQWMERAASLIHDGGALAGIAIRPKTPVSAIESALASFDMALVMSVEPGFSGQSYIEGSDKKVEQIVRYARAAGYDLLVEVDGGMGEATVSAVCAAGADVIVCGNAVFKNEDPARAIARVGALGDKARLDALGR